jgi:hypothetical protein
VGALYQLELLEESKPHQYIAAHKRIETASQITLRWITWSLSIPNVKISIVLADTQETAFERVVQASEPNIGAYTLVVPDLPRGQAYRVKLSSATDSRIATWGEAFVIHSAGTLRCELCPCVPPAGWNLCLLSHVPPPPFPFSELCPGEDCDCQLFLVSTECC